jgi:hypothetical protein
MSNFEDTFNRILRHRMRGRVEKRGKPPRKMDLGDTSGGRGAAIGFVEPVRVVVPAEFLGPQPAMARPTMGVFLPARKGRKRR